MKKLLFYFIKQKWWLLIILTTIVPIFSYVSVQTSIQIKNIINSFVDNRNVLNGIGVFVILSATTFLLGNIIQLVSSYLNISLSVYLKKYVLDRLFNYRTFDLDKENLLELWNKDISEFADYILSIINPSIINVSVGLVALYQLTRINVWFSVFTVVISLLLIPLMKIFGNKVSLIAAEKREKTQKLNNQMLNFYKNKFLILNYGISSWIKGNLNELAKNISRNMSIFNQVNNLSRISKRVVSSLLPICILLYSAYLFSNYDINIGEIVASLSLTTIVSTGINSLIDVYTKLRITEKRSKSLDEFYKELVFNKKKQGWFNHGIYNIELKDVSYTTIEEKVILKNISLEIKQGEKIAIVGDSGSGKSTLIKIIMGLTMPTEGKIYVNNQLLKKEMLTNYWKKIIYIPTNIYIKPGTLLSNLRNDDSEDVEINEIGLNNLSRLIGVDHDNISGGEEKKVAFLRELKRKRNNQTLTVMDEISTGVDINTVNYMARKIIDIKGTVLLVTHDQYLASKMDRVIKISDGKIIFQKFK